MVSLNDGDHLQGMIELIQEPDTEQDYSQTEYEKNALVLSQPRRRGW
jgi:hypothetical protein